MVLRYSEWLLESYYMVVNGCQDNGLWLPSFSDWFLACYYMVARMFWGDCQSPALQLVRLGVTKQYYNLVAKMFWVGARKLLFSS